MTIYKFKDSVDGKHAFVIARNEGLAKNELETQTSLPFKLVNSKSLKDYGKPIIMRNDMLPF